jgi:hypothetical protein
MYSQHSTAILIDPCSSFTQNTAWIIIPQSGVEATTPTSVEINSYRNTCSRPVYCVTQNLMNTEIHYLLVIHGLKQASGNAQFDQYSFLLLHCTLYLNFCEMNFDLISKTISIGQMTNLYNYFYPLLI